MANSMRRFSLMSSTHQSVVSLAMIFTSLQLLRPVSSLEFQVGDRSGWVVPPPNDTRIYNDWASQKRFEVGDIIRFKYRKDSVMEVNETDYKRCNSTLPNFFSNSGNTIFTLGHSGYFYFISGAAGHCEKGQRMILKVMAAAMDQHGSGSGGPKTSSTSRSSVAMFTAHQLLIALPTFQLFLFYLVSHFFLA